MFDSELKVRDIRTGERGSVGVQFHLRSVLAAAKVEAEQVDVAACYRVADEVGGCVTPCIKEILERVLLIVSS